MSNRIRQEHLRMIMMADQAWTVIGSMYSDINEAIKRNADNEDRDVQLLMVASKAALGYVMQRQVEARLAMMNETNTQDADGDE